MPKISIWWSKFLVMWCMIGSRDTTETFFDQNLQMKPREVSYLRVEEVNSWKKKIRTSISRENNIFSVCELDEDVHVFAYR